MSGEKSIISAGIAKISAMIGLVGGLLAIIAFMFTHFVSKEAYQAEITRVEQGYTQELKRLEGFTGSILDEIISNQNDIKVEIERSRIEIIVQALKVRRDFLRSRQNLSETEQRELQVLDQSIDEYLSLIN
jgi:hypothetical protein